MEIQLKMIKNLQLRAITPIRSRKWKEGFKHSEHIYLRIVSDFLL